MLQRSAVGFIPGAARRVVSTARHHTVPEGSTKGRQVKTQHFSAVCSWPVHHSTVVATRGPNLHRAAGLQCNYSSRVGSNSSPSPVLQPSQSIVRPGLRSTRLGSFPPPPPPPFQRRKAYTFQRRGYGYVSVPVDSIKAAWARLELTEAEMTVYAIFGIDTAVFWLWQLARSRPALAQRMLDHFTASYPGVFQHKRLHTLLTCGMSHHGLIHFLCNHISLYSFGIPCCTVLGPVHFLQMYAAGAVISSLSCILWNATAPRLNIPAAKHTKVDTRLVGASGVVYTLIAWFTCKAPDLTIGLFFGAIELPAYGAALLLISGDLVGLYFGKYGIAHAAHLGGALVGVGCFLVGEVVGQARFLGINSHSQTEEIVRLLES